MGIRLIEDFLAKSGWTRCSDFRETAQILSAVAFKMFLNCCPLVIEFQGNDKEFGLVFTGEGEATLPIYEFVSLPDEFVKDGLFYGNILPGLIKGSLEMVIKL
jgi:trafficking protein particle complex subunit 3